MALAFAVGTATAAGPAGSDLGNARVEADPVARTLVVDGVIGPQFETDVRDALLSDPAIKRVVVRSPGGLRAQALRVGEFINGRGVTVRVEGRCASACVLLWATARSREMTEDSRIGLHRSTLDAALPIPDAMREQLMSRNDRETEAVLLKAGFPTDVVAAGSATPATTMAWFDARRLKALGVPFSLLGREVDGAGSVASAGVNVGGSNRGATANHE